MRFFNGYQWLDSAPLRAKSKHKIWPWIAGGIAVLILFIGMIGAAGSDKSDKRTATTVPVVTAEPAAQSLGSEVRDGKFAFVVTQVERAGKTVGAANNQFMQEDAQGEWIVIHMTVTNIGKAPQSFTPSAQVLRVGDKSYEYSSLAAMYLDSSYTDINPGNSIQVRLPFDVPEGAQPNKIILHDSSLSGGAAVTL
ncbi:DUF4352 domain-containing protein [Mycobacteroides abscessus subsp. abscessus]|nr:DUF4352 domain-containing protein [Mycobacteroides abscessus subsp. abscessus]